MKREYDAIARAGFILQVDCPDLASGWNNMFFDATLPQFLEKVALHLDVLGEATRDVPAGQLRLHLCWGNYPGPHHHDIPLEDFIDIVWTAKPQTVLFEGANPRHSHEWSVLKEIGVPKDKFICPGVIEPQSNYIEHPEVIAQRLARWAEVVPPALGELAIGGPEAAAYLLAPDFEDGIVPAGCIRAKQVRCHLLQLLLLAPHAYWAYTQATRGNWDG